MSQVDAAIGGKTAVNLFNIKNLIGTINQPQAVFIDINWLKTLPKREFSSGMAEIIKYGIGFDNEILKLISGRISHKNLLNIIEKAICVKVQAVEKDPHETRGIRKLLNLGHTLGHSLEAQQNMNLNHGESVAVGLLFTAYIAFKNNNITGKELFKIQKILSGFSLPLKVKIDINRSMEKIMHDKKRINNAVEFITIRKIGRASSSIMSRKQLKVHLKNFSKYITNFIC